MEQTPAWRAESGSEAQTEMSWNVKRVCVTDTKKTKHSKVQRTEKKSQSEENAKPCTAWITADEDL